MSARSLAEIFPVDDDTNFDPEFMNKLIREIGSRIETLEVLRDAATEVMKRAEDTAIDRVNDIVIPVTNALREGEYTSALVVGAVPFAAAANVELELQVTGVIGFLPSPAILIGRTSTLSDVAIARTISWDKTTSLLRVEILAALGTPGPHSDCYVEVGLLSAMFESGALNDIVTRHDDVSSKHATIITKAAQVAADRASTNSDRTAVAADRITVSTDRASVAANRAAVDAALASIAGGPVASVNGKTGVAFTDPTRATDIVPVLDWDFTDRKGAPFTGYFVRSTSGGYVRKRNGLFVPVAVNEPFIDVLQDGRPTGTGFYGGYTNLLTQSENWGHADWGLSGLTVTSDVTKSPDGTQGADKLVSSNATDYMFNWRTFATVAGGDYTFSVFVKAAGWSGVVLQAGGGTAWAAQGENSGVRFDLSNGSINGAHNGQATSNARIEDCGDGWYRVSVKWTAAAAGTGTVLIFITSTPGTTAPPTGNGVAGVFAWGGQVTQTSFPVPYIKTTTAAVTRSPDTMAIGDADFADLFSLAEGTLFIEARSGVAIAQQTLWQMDGGSERHRILIYRNTSSQLVAQVVFDGAQAFALNLGTVADHTPFRVALTWKGITFKVSLNGAAIVSGTASSFPPVNTLRLGQVSGGGLRWNSAIKRLIYWPWMLTDAELGGVTR